MTAKHTAGPWKHEGDGDITGIENDPENGCVGLVDVASVYLRTVPGRTEANARLIAAAPLLLDAMDYLAMAVRWVIPDISHLPLEHATCVEALKFADEVAKKAQGDAP